MPCRCCRTISGLSLVFASWIVGAFGALGAAFGLFAGGIVSMFRPRATLIAGLCIIGCASLAGAAAPNGVVLLVTRVIEGCGFLAAVLSAPRLLRVVSQPADSDRVFAFWAAYLPCGSALMMLIGPLLTHSWQILWLANGVIALAYAALVALFPFPSAPDADKAGAAAANVMRVVTSPGAIVLSLAFSIYTFHYFALTGLFPSLLVDQLGLSITAAGFISALTVLANGIGNLIAGIIFKRGIPVWADRARGLHCDRDQRICDLRAGHSGYRDRHCRRGHARDHGLYSGLDLRRRAAHRIERPVARDHHRPDHERQQYRAIDRPGSARGFRATFRLGQGAASVCRRGCRRDRHFICLALRSCAEDKIKPAGKAPPVF